MIDDDDRRDRVDLGRHAEPDLRVDVDRQRRRADARVERRDDQVVERQRERQHRPGRDRRQQQRQRHVPERAPRRRPEVARGLLQLRVEVRGARPDDDRHVRDAERDVGDRDLLDRALAVEQLPEEQQQADAHDDLRASPSAAGAASPPPPRDAVAQPREPEAQQRAQDRRARSPPPARPRASRPARSSRSSLREQPRIPVAA